MATSPPKKSSARQRIVETAERLFYAEGFRSVGIDRIIAEADVAKMTLYNHFRSKDDLIVEVLSYREEQFDKTFRDWMKRHQSDGLDRLDAFFAALKQWFESPGFRGCSFINATVELADADHEATKFAAHHKARFRQWLGEILVGVAGESTDPTADAIFLLVEGAIVTAVMRRQSDPADVARDAAVTLLGNCPST